MRPLIVMLFLYAMQAAAQTLAVSPRSQNLDMNHASSVQLRVDSIAQLRAYSVTLQFDTRILHCLTVKEMNFFSSKYQTFFFSYTDTAKGTVRIDAAILGEGAVNGSGILAEIQFKGSKTGTSGIQIVNTDFRVIGTAQPTLTVAHGSIRVDVLSSVGPDKPSTPSTPAIANYPNPFNPQTDIVCTLPENGFGSAAVYAMDGRLLDVLEKGFLRKGTHRWTWNAARFSSGSYIAVVRTEQGMTASKLILIK